ncbi:MAG: ribosomal-protein-alanine N-acetyltransferase [Saprospiraceae bacterium]
MIDLSDFDFIHKLHCLPETDEFNTLGIPNNIEETKAIIEPWIAANN